jgi:hypothetical protein
MKLSIDERHEWLEADGRGGFASGTTSGIRTRRYHALLLTATTPPTGRVVLVNGFDAWLDTNAGTPCVQPHATAGAGATSSNGAVQRSSPVSGTKPPVSSPMSWTSIIVPALATIRVGPTRSSPWAGFQSRCSMANGRGESWMRSRIAS